MTKSLLQEKAAQLRELKSSQNKLVEEWNEFANQKNKLQAALDATNLELMRIKAAQTCVDEQIDMVARSMEEILRAR